MKIFKHFLSKWMCYSQTLFYPGGGEINNNSNQHLCSIFMCKTPSKRLRHIDPFNPTINPLSKYS